MALQDPSKAASSVLETIGHTPLLKLNRSVPKDSAEIYAKIEFFNPGGSLKDRVSLGLIEAAEREGLLNRGSVVVEATSGNTAVGLALVCAVKKYRLVLVMPENYGPEYRKALSAYGAELVLTPVVEGMEGAIRKAEDLVQKTPGAFAPRQFKSRVNPEIHRDTTAKEILAEIPAPQIAAFVTGIGSGGTITGLGGTLKKENPKLHVTAVRFPNTWMVKEGVLQLEKVKKGAATEVLDSALIDEVVDLSDREAYQFSKKLARDEGLLVGLESGAAFYGALKAAERLGKGKKVVTIFPDAGGRYFSLEKYFQER